MYYFQDGKVYLLDARDGKYYPVNVSTTDLTTKVDSQTSRIQYGQGSRTTTIAGAAIDTLTPPYDVLTIEQLISKLRIHEGNPYTFPLA